MSTPTTQKKIDRRRVPHPGKLRCIRVSDPRWAEIKRRAAEEGKTIAEWLIAGRV